MESPHAPSPPAFEAEELRPLLADLERGLSRPLEALRNALERLARDGGAAIAAEQRGHVAASLALSDNLLGLTDSFFHFARLAAAPMAPSVEPVRLGDLAADVDRRHASRAQELGLNWECGLEGEDSVVTTDPAAYGRAIDELASNALKFSPRSGRVRVVVGRREDSWGVVVEDQGPGIPPEARGKVFEPFVRLPRDERAGIPGDGLGLAICRSLVDRLGGTIVLQAAVPAGTRARVTFPVAGPRR